MGGANDVEALMGRVRAGCPRAAQEVFDRYSDAVRRVVRRVLRDRLRAKYDSTDFVQSVWASFFLTPPERYNFDTPQQLVNFLSKVAFHNNVRVGDRTCRVIESVHPTKKTGFLFHMVKVYIDNEHNLPIRFEAYDGSSLGPWKSIRRVGAPGSLRRWRAEPLGRTDPRDSPNSKARTIACR